MPTSNSHDVMAPLADIHRQAVEASRPFAAVMAQALSQVAQNVPNGGRPAPNMERSGKPRAKGHP